MGQSGRQSSHHPLLPAPLADVEVSELTLDEEEFSSTFGSLITQFDELDLGAKVPPQDPWSSRRRID